MGRILVVSLALVLGLNLTACRRGGSEPEGIFVASPQGHLRTGWMRPLVHSEIEPFYARRLAATPESREEFDNLVRLIIQGLGSLRRVAVGTVSLGYYLQATEGALLGEDATGETQGFLIYHVRHDLDGHLAAEGLTLTLGREVDRSEQGIYLFTLHMRLEDLVEEGAVDGQLDQLQFVIDTNSPALGCIEVVLERQPSAEGTPALFDYAISRLYDSTPTSREGTIAYRGEDNTEVAEWMTSHLWEPFRGDNFTALVEHDPQGHLLPGEVVRLPRQEWNVPEGSNFPPSEAVE